MTFARKVWHLLVAIKDGLALLVLLGFFFLLYLVLTMRPNVGDVREGALLLRLNGSVVEEASQPGAFDFLMPGAAPTEEFRARDLVRAIRAARDDTRIKAVVLDLSTFAGGGTASLQEIGAAMDSVRASGKPVLTWAVGYADSGVLLAAHASEAWVDPMGGAVVAGPGGQHLYFAQALDRLKVNIHVFRVGTYKDFVEPYIRSDQSEPSKEAAQALYGAVWDTWKADVRRARPKAQIDAVTRDPVGFVRSAGGDLARASLAAGLVDRIGDKVAFGTRVAQIAGRDPFSRLPGRFAYTPLAAWLADHPEDTSGKGIAVVTVAGTIVDGDAGPGSAGGDRIARLIDRANADDAPALVLRVDSPGGSVMASERIRSALVRYKAPRNGVSRPVVVSMGNVAASGGYWVSTPGEAIFAEPATITGSIGIFAVIPSFEKTLANWGVTADGVRTTPLSGQPDPLSGFTPEVEALLQANVENGYARFIGLVAQSRRKTPQEVDAIAQGRVWDGGTARQIGLVDRFGTLDDALGFAAQRAGLAKGGWHPVFMGLPKSPYASLLRRWREGDDPVGGDDGTDMVGLVAGQDRARAGAALAQAATLLSRPSAQALCLACPAPLAAAPAAKAPTWLALLLRAAAL
ncbi:signal peptide peptidase SppA [Parablastomonas sp. CN1-191]|uniref:signal peptide peptidase SppA n=1 Tax=Parablastomonas sp. CN1-191 TaxID=3400908 RepID=UPI003BF7DCE3